MGISIKKASFQCKLSTEWEFSNAVLGASSGNRTNIKRLRDYTCPITIDYIPWYTIQALYVLGSGNLNCNTALVDNSLSSDILINHNGSQLLLIHPDDSTLLFCIDHCSDHLRRLHLYNTTLDHITLPALTSLERLSIRDNNNLSELFGLEKLTSLARMNLSGCGRLMRLPELGKLVSLTSLELNHCSSITMLPGLENLDSLVKLNLRACISLIELPSLRKLIHLAYLNLIECEGLISLPEMIEPTSLTELYLRDCRCVKEVPACLRYNKKLRTLDLRGLHLRSLPDWLPEIAETFSLVNGLGNGKETAIVYLKDTTVDTIPDMSIFEQPYEVVKKWFEDCNKVPLNEIKVVFLGDGEAGKSHTIARLMNDGGDPVDYTDQSTPGIVIKHKPYTHDGRNFQVHYWDFGGQEIMHSMHRIFLTNRTMYVVLLNARDDTQGDRARYWLHNVRSFAPDAPVLLVLNKIDQNENASVDEVDLRSRHDQLTQVVKLSALNFSREEFNRSFTDVLLDEILKTGYLDAQWPISWTQVKDELENMATHYISGSDYQDICAKYQVDKNQKPLLHWFNDLGISFCCCGDEDYALEDYVILRPDWITNALYIILFNHLEGAQNGLIPHKSIYDLLKNAHNNPAIRCTMPHARYTSGDIQYVLGIMRKFSLSFPHGEDHEFLPMLCQQNSTVNVQYYRQDSEVLEFTMEFDYLPNNLLHRLMVERHAELDMDNVWRTGARFQLKELGYSAVVAIDGNALRFFIRHSNSMHRPNTYLTMLKANVDRIRQKMGLKEPTCSLTYKLHDKRDTFDYEMLKAMQEAGQKDTFSMTWRRMIPIQDIFNQSAPDGLQNEMLLLTAIQEACGRIQDEPIYRLVKNSNGKGYENGKGMEDLRNRRVRDDLLIQLRDRFQVCDQTQIGSSGSGKSIGELDMLIRKKNNEPWTIIEALRIEDDKKGSWNDHLDKLLVKYNSRGLSLLYLLTYVDANPQSFVQICDEYKTHIPRHASGQYAYVANSFTDLNDNKNQSFHAVKCLYSCGGDPITVYHIFARIPLDGE